MPARPDAPPAQARGEIRALTGLRGVAACHVVLYHMVLFQLRLDTAGLPWPVRTLLGHGYLAVDLFFVLSGFVLAMTYAPLFARGITREAYGDFLLRRVARVWPLYALLTLLTAGTSSAFQLLANLLLVQSWCLADSIVGQAWSISTEWASYLAFPLLLTATLSCRRSRAAVTALVAASLLAALVLVPSSLSGTVRAAGPLDFYSGTNYAPLVRCLCEFTLGLLAWRVARPGAGGRPGGWPPRLATAAALLVPGLLALPGTDLPFALAVPLLVLGMSGGRGLAARLLATPVLHWLGRISYALYLVHGLTRLYRRSLHVLVLTSGVPLPGTVELMLLFASTLLLATIAHHSVERPARHWLRHLSSFHGPAIRGHARERAG